MFSKIGVTTAILLLTSTAGIYHFQIKPHPNDQAEYRQLAKWVGRKTALANPIIQERKGVQKEIWSMSKNQRTRFRLNSEDSHLTITPTGKSIEICEQLHNLDCFLQENEQEIRTLTAKEGIYLFPSHQFFSDEVALKFYRNNLLYLQGNVFEVAFGAKDSSLTFTADYLQVDLDPKKYEPIRSQKPR